MFSDLFFDAGYIRRLLQRDREEIERVVNGEISDAYREVISEELNTLDSVLVQLQILQSDYELTL